MTELSGVGRTLLSDAFEVDFALGNVKHERTQKQGESKAEDEGVPSTQARS